MNWIKTKKELPPAREMVLFHSVSECCELIGIYASKSNKFISSSVHYFADDVPYWSKITDPTDMDRYPDLFGVNDLISHEKKRASYKDDQIAFLWKLLDDISTAGDQFKPEIDGYFKSVNTLCTSRGEVANSFDGQTLTIKEFFE